MGQVQPFCGSMRCVSAFTRWFAARPERVLATAFKIEGDVDNPRLVLEMLVLELASSRRRSSGSGRMRAHA